jgi:hypothetical protein
MRYCLGDNDEDHIPVAESLCIACCNSGLQNIYLDILLAENHFHMVNAVFIVNLAVSFKADALIKFQSI